MIYFSLFFGLFCIFRELYIVSKTKSLKLINIFGIMFGSTYGILTSYFLYQRISYPHLFSRYFNVYEQWIWITLAILSYLLIQFVYYYNKPKSNVINRSYSLSNRDINALQYTAIGTMVIGVVSFYLWMWAYGSVINLIIEAPLIRDGISDIKNPYSFMMRWTGILQISSLCFIKLIQLKHKKILNSLLFVVSLYFNVVRLLAQDGRFSAVMYIAVLLFIAINLMEKGNATRRNLVLTLTLAFIALFGISQMDRLTYFIREKESMVVVEKLEGENFISEEFMYIYDGASQASSELLIEGSPMLFSHDFVLGLCAWLPSSFRPEWVNHVWRYNTQKLTNGTTKGVKPCDYVTMSIYCLGYWGFFIYALIWGIIIRVVDSMHEHSGSLFFSVVYYIFVISIIYLVNYCSIHSFILGLFPIFIAYCIWIVSRRIQPSCR